MYPEHLEITAIEIVTASTNHVILNTAHVLPVDVNVDITAVPVVQNVFLVTMVTIVKNHVMDVC